MQRRDFLVGAGASAAGALMMVNQPAHGVGEPAERGKAGRLKQSVARWCFGGVPLEELCEQGRAMGLASVELLDHEQWGVPARFGLVCALGNGPSTILDGYNNPKNHDRFAEALESLIPKASDLGVPSIIVFSGGRGACGDAEGIEHCAAGLARSVKLAEKHGVNLVMELLNSKVDHPGYMCDRTAWGAALVDKVASERFKLLYDIYHMQIMEGDVIRTIRDHAGRIGHYHTAGVPGRREINGSQELHYPAICRAIAESGFQGYLAQEFIPSGEPFAALRESVQICTV